MAVALASLLPVHAAEEGRYTAGVSMGKETDEEISTYARARVEAGWKQDAKGWWYQDEDGGWAHREPGGRLTENGIILPVTVIGEKMPMHMRIR